MAFFSWLSEQPLKRDMKVRPDITKTNACNKTQTNKQNRLKVLMRVKLTYYCIWLIMCSTYRFHHFLIFDLIVSFVEMRGLLLILVCGLFQPVTLSDMLEAMEGQLLLDIPTVLYPTLFSERIKPFLRKARVSKRA